MPTYTITIGGSGKQPLLGSLSIVKTLNGLDRLRCKIVSTDGSYRPAKDTVITVLENSDTIFGGLIQTARERWLQSKDWDGIVTEVEAVDYSTYTQRRLVDDTFAAGTLKSILTTLVDDYLDVYGVALDAGQVNGPTLEEIVVNDQTAEQFLNQLATISGYVWKIDHAKKLKMWSPTATAAPFSVTSSNRKAVGDIIVEVTDDDLYANRVFVDVTGGGPATSTETFGPSDYTTSGGFRYFTAKYPASTNINDMWPNVLLFDGVVQGPIGRVVTNPQSWDVPTNAWDWDMTVEPARLRYTIASGAGFPTTEDIQITYAIAYPFTVSAEDAGEIASRGPWEVKISVSQGLSLEAAQALADAELARRIAELKTVRYDTYETGLALGQYQTVNVTERNFNDDVLITELAYTDVGRRDQTLLKRVTGQQSLQYQETWRRTVINWNRVGGGSTLASTGVSGVARLDYAQHVTVAKYGADFINIQDAIDSITDASSSKRYIVEIYPGKYEEQVTMKDWVDIRGKSKHDVEIEFGSTGGAIVLADHCQIEDLLIQNSSTEGHWGIVGDNTSHWHIRNVDFLAPFGSSKRGAGIKVTGSSWNTGFIEHCILNCYTESNQCIRLESDGSDLADVTMNDVFCDTFEATTGGSVLLNNIIDTQIRSSFFRTNSGGYCVRVTGTSEITLIDSWLEFGTSSLEVTGGTVQVQGCVVNSYSHTGGTLRGTYFAADGSAHFNLVNGNSFVRKTGDESVTNSTTLQADDALLFAVGASETWEFDFQVHYLGNSTGDFRCGLKFPTSPTQIYYGIVGPATAATGVPITGDAIFSGGFVADAVAGLPLGADTGVSVATLRGYVRNGSNAGDVVLWWAQGTSDGTATTVKAGSYLIARRIA